MLFLDLDGTILDTTRRHYATYVELLQSPEFRGVPLPEKEYWYLKREAKPWDDVLKASRLFPTKFALFKERFEERLETAEMLLLDRIREGTETFLGKMYTKTPIVLVTQRREGVLLENQLASFKLRSYFVEVLFGAPKATRRVDKDARWKHKVSLIRKRYKLPPQEAVFLGDTETDVKVARDLGWTIFLVEGGHRSRALQIKADPDRLVPDLPGALKFLLAQGRWQR